MEGLNTGASIFACFALLFLGCGVDSETQPDQAKKQTAEEKAIVFLKTKGASLQWLRPKSLSEPGGGGALLDRQSSR